MVKIRIPFGRTRGFTLIELLVVVAIIALLISILLPSLQNAREAARTSVCGSLLRGMGTGMQTYVTENNGWIPGVNTSGATFRLAYTMDPSNLLGVLRSGSMPVQAFDWMSPILRYDTELGQNRAERFRTLINRYSCPSQLFETGVAFYPDNLAGVPDATDFRQILTEFHPLSYLMPSRFQYWGLSDTDAMSPYVFGVSPNGARVTALGLPATFETRIQNYRSKIEKIGNAGRKLMATDGTRYLDDSLILDFDVLHSSTQFGSFTSNSGWWAGCRSHGVRANSRNWDGQPVAVGSLAGGLNLALTYRHGAGARGNTPVDAHSNQGTLNGAFFDGSVRRMTDRQSREIEYWYPKGSIVNTPSEGMTLVPQNFEIP
ncbi:MAG: hypothetical protein AMXMBFR47_33370 [Planctomycetota bacterium]